MHWLKAVAQYKIVWEPIPSVPVVDAQSHPLVYIPDWEIPGIGRVKIWIDSALGLIRGSGENADIRIGDQHFQTGSCELFETLEQLDAAMSAQNENPAMFYLGAVSYDYGRQLERVTINADFYRLPEFVVILPANGWIWDEKLERGWRFHSSQAVQMNRPNKPPSDSIEPLSVNKERYRQKIEQIRSLITQGEVYQINYTIRFSHPVKTHGWPLFQKLYRENPAPYSVYCNLDGGELLSISPERFLYQRGSKVLTEPIKGTVRRGQTADEDDQLKKWLMQSAKNQAELNMIIDLLRNDLARNCRAGSVRVLRKKELRSFANVHHLVGVVQGKLNQPAHIWRLFRDAFPGGSITGCPKIAAMNYISHLEPHGRSFYTGSFFVRFPKLNILDSNILIRTAILTGEQVHFQVGGGIVIDSEPEEEYAECVAKAASFLKVMEVSDAAVL